MLTCYRQLFCWMDQWYGMTIPDIRELEEQIKRDLDVQRNEGTPIAVPSPDSASIAASSIKSNKEGRR